MIGLTFAMSFMLVFMLAVALTDFVELVMWLRDEIEESFGHDTRIYPDGQ